MVFAPPSQSSSQARARSTSPTKRGRTTIDKEKPDAKIQLVDLESCEPSVHLRSRARVIQGGELPPMVAELDDLLHIKHGRFIPLQLKPFFDREAATPRKTRRSLSAHDYLPDTDTSFPEEFGPSIKGNVERVVEATEDNQTMQVHERQWGWTTISPLLNEVLVWPQNRGAVLVNVESCAVNPEEIRMLRPGRQRYVDETNSTTSTSANNSVTTTRMVDICLALNLEDTAREVVTRSWATWPDNLRSLNQTVSYIRIRPLFLDIEIKQLNQDREPLVQLGIWMAGLYEKRKLHGWDQSAPMPGLVVNGDRWDLYIGFARGDGVIMMASPTPFGSTATIAGTFEILYKLNILVQWGLKQYRRWFDEHMLEWFSRERAPGVYDD
ncbi:MAG: hypothetical protein Q9202_005804 [Teloschistes flavicans]